MLPLNGIRRIVYVFCTLVETTACVFRRGDIVVVGSAPRCGFARRSYEKSRNILH